MVPFHRDRSTWPDHMRAGAVRFARTSAHYEETVRFYGELVGLAVIDDFTASFGEDGTIFGLPDTKVQLEVLRAHHETDAPNADQLVIYLDNAQAVLEATRRLQAAGSSPNTDAHPYYAANGAVTYDDP